MALDRYRQCHDSTGLSEIADLFHRQEATGRRQKIHDLVGEICVHQLSHSQGNRPVDEQLLDRWRRALFAVIEPPHARATFYVPDKDGSLNHYWNLSKALQRLVKGRSDENRMVSVFSRIVNFRRLR